MKLLLPLLAAVASFGSSVAHACPYGSGPTGCGACGSSLLGHGTALLLGLGIGLASVAFDRRRG